jgi:hypothetical protein
MLSAPQFGPLLSSMVSLQDMEVPMQCPSLRMCSILFLRPGFSRSSDFHRWLGQNSKQAKLNRQLGDVQIRMRLKVSGDKSEIRQSYLPALFPHIVRTLIDIGAVRVFLSILYLMVLPFLPERRG